MRICQYQDIEGAEVIPGVIKRNVITADDGAPTFCMRVFEVEPGAAAPPHTHDWEHEVFVLAGQGVAISEEKETPIASGSVIFIPPNEYHSIRNSGNEKLRFVCLIPVGTE